LVFWCREREEGEEKGIATLLEILNKSDHSELLHVIVNVDTEICSSFLRHTTEEEKDMIEYLLLFSTSVLLGGPFLEREKKKACQLF
jgi:hypothetical protein